MKAGFSIQLILYIARIVRDELSRRIVRAELSNAELSAPNCTRRIVLRRIVREPFIYTAGGVFIQLSGAGEAEKAGEAGEVFIYTACNCLLIDGTVVTSGTQIAYKYFTRIAQKLVDKLPQPTCANVNLRFPYPTSFAIFPTNSEEVHVIEVDNLCY